MSPSTFPTSRDPICVGADIGGSHITAALHDAHTGELLPGSLVRHPVDSRGQADAILQSWADTLRHAISQAQDRQLAGIGIAMPGPFEYDRGISRIEGLTKYDALYGMNIRAELKERLATDIPILFRNDASCFILGEHWIGAAKGFHRVIGITLGTGFGSAFLADGELVESGDCVPSEGWLYRVPFHDQPAEEWFSGRGLQRIANEVDAQSYPSLREYADAVRAGSESPAGFERYGALMGEFLAPWIERFSPDALIIGGNISRSLDLFLPNLQQALKSPLSVRPSALLEMAALAGAASLPLQLREPNPVAS